jgi:isoleucyl-tRNA synthetase
MNPGGVAMPIAPALIPGMSLVFSTWDCIGDNPEALPMFNDVDGRYDGPTLEKRVLDFWKAQAVFAATLEASAGRPEFVFYEGPPTANGKPGIHHVLARTFKDLFLRYKTMRGFHCPRKAGWDTHGLPVEHEVEKALGIFDKRRIEREVGVARFVELCRASVMRYVADWEAMTTRMGFWVDLEAAYLTLDNEYIESVWNLLKRLWDKELIYQGYKVVPYDPRIGATLSSHEVALGYRDVEDPSIFVRFRLVGEPSTSFLVWTTTPWTLPANLLLAVNAAVDYVWVERGDETLILARELLAVLGDAPYRIVKSAPGTQLEGLQYQRLFDFLPVEGEICRVRTADFVTTDAGTGIVHIAPAYGEDDLKLGLAHGLPVLHCVGEDGCFLPQVTPVAGLFFKAGDPIITALLQDCGALFREARYTHSYPFGWRTGDPLMYYAKNAWYIKTTAVKQRMVELNQGINWIPPNIRDGRFGDWLKNNIDWALSRERFWGTPLPVWTDGHGDYICIGSIAELEQRVGRTLKDLDLHRPAIDAVTFMHAGRKYSRVAEVIDCWFDSGAMPYAQLHYPFGDSQERFTRRFPADYICEAIDQTRGWFYTLHAIATLTCDSVAYKNVICLGHIVDENGKKMSKSLGNIIRPEEVFDAVGADALRWHFAARVAPDMQKRVSVELISNVASSFINTYWNTYAFFVLYARLDGIDPRVAVDDSALAVLDRWILALLERTKTCVTEAMDRYDVQAAGTAIEMFVDQLSTWYVRRSRRRFWKATEGADKQAAYRTLYQCLEAVTYLMAPIVPFLAEEVFQNLVRRTQADAPVSVHMAPWPAARPEYLDAQLLEDMAVVQRVVGLGRAARSKSNLKIRQPLARLLVRVPDAAASRAIEAHAEQLREELNVKAVEVVAADAQLMSYRIKVNLPAVGKRYGRLIPAIRAALAAADARSIALSCARGEPILLQTAAAPVELHAADLLVETTSATGFVCEESEGYLVGLDTTLNEALLREGLAREMVRSVQEARKQAGLDVADRIVLMIEGDARVSQAIQASREYLMNETLAVRWELPTGPKVYCIEHEEGDLRWKISLSVA